MKTFRTLLVSLILISPFLVPAEERGERAGTNSGGGGQECENRIQVIRDNIRNWISVGNHKKLNYFIGLDADSYAYRMNKFLAITVNKDRSITPFTAINCTDEKVKVDGYDKDCRFNFTDRGPKITCNTDAFLKKSSDDQYWLVHHEFAGLAGIEPPSGPHSVYLYSNQISSKTERRQVSLLPVEQATQDLGDFLRDTNGKINKRAGCENYQMLPTVRMAAMDAAKHGGAIVEVEDFKKGNLPPGFIADQFYKINSIDIIGSWALGYQYILDQFYYSHDKYVRPRGEQGEYWIWTSSRQNTGLQDSGTYFYDGLTGMISVMSANANPDNFGVRCVADQKISSFVVDPNRNKYIYEEVEHHEYMGKPYRVVHHTDMYGEENRAAHENYGLHMSPKQCLESLVRSELGRSRVKWRKQIGFHYQFPGINQIKIGDWSEVEYAREKVLLGLFRDRVWYRDGYSFSFQDSNGETYAGLLGATVREVTLDGKFIGFICRFVDYSDTLDGGYSLLKLYLEDSKKSVLIESWERPPLGGD